MYKSTVGSYPDEEPEISGPFVPLKNYLNDNTHNWSSNKYEELETGNDLPLNEVEDSRKSDSVKKQNNNRDCHQDRQDYDHTDSVLSSKKFEISSKDVKSTESCSSSGYCDSTCSHKSISAEDLDDGSGEHNGSTTFYEDFDSLMDAVVDIDDDDDDDEKLRLQTTKLRVQNVCCPKEAQIVGDEMKKLKGIKSTRMNVMGRVVHITHYPDIVSPIELMNALNNRHLGASIVDTGEEEADYGFPNSLKILLVFLAIQAALFAMSLTGLFTHSRWYMWIAIVQICIGMIPVLRLALLAAKNLQIDLNILITITVIGTLTIGEWIDGAAVVFVFTMATFLQQFCFYRVQKTISSLMLAKPSKAVIASTGEYVLIEEVPVGCIIAVRQGELIPLDGVVVKGSGSVDESSISGEAAPVEKKLNSQTFSGTVIQHGYLEIETTSSSKSSTISKISEMVEEAQLNASPIEIMVNKFAKYYTPLVVCIAALVFLIPLFLGVAQAAPLGKIKLWGEMALIVLVTACPCSLLMATPTVVICGINGAARHGALVKGGTFLEALTHLTFVAFDKTGTLTEGKFEVVDLVSVDKDVENEVLRWVAALESKSSHPLSAAVVSKFTGECIADFIADSEELHLPEVSSFRTIEGQGISGEIEGHYIQVGNRTMLEKLNVTLPPEFQASFNAFSSESKTVVFACVDGELALMISLTDIIRLESYAALKWLQDLGISVIMLTGDARKTANAVQKELKLDRCVSEMKPTDKLKWINEIKQEQIEGKTGCCKKKRNQTVGMVGDGVNDGPALAAADVGIAMGAGGSALAVEAGGVALMTNSLLTVPELISLSRFCRRVIIQNITFAVGLKLIFLAVALTGYVRVWMAVIADLVGLLVVIINGLRPLKWESAKKKTIKKLASKVSLFGKKSPYLLYKSLTIDSH